MTKKTRNNKMYIVIGILLIIIGAVVVWFNIPYSPVKAEFKHDTERLVQKNALPESGRVFAMADFADMPAAIREYISHCGYIGKPVTSGLRMDYKNVAFRQGRNGPELTIDYTQYDLAAEPCRLALIDSSMFGVPFEGYDYYSGGKGGMKGVIAKSITLFDQTGDEMDKACLATWLAECLFCPSALTSGFVSLEEINDRQVKASATFAGQTAGGVFTFNEQYEMISFTTEDRAATGADGSVEYIPWSAICGGYEPSESGILQPTVFKAVWNYPDGDFIYFDGAISSITYF